MTSASTSRASMSSVLLVGLGLAFGACGSQGRQPDSSSSADAGRTDQNTSGGGTSTSSAGAGGVSLPAGGTPAMGGSHSGGARAGGTDTPGTTGGSAGADDGVGGAAKGGEESGGLGTSGTASGASATGGASRGGSAAGGAGGRGGSGAGGLATGGGTSAATGGATAGETGTGATGAGGAGMGGAATGGASNATGGGAVTGPLTELPSASSVLEAMRRANSYFVARWPDPTVDIVTDKTRPSNLWTRAIYYEGLMSLYAVEPDATRKASYYDYAVTWASSPAHPYTLTYTSAGTMTDNADNQACGQTYVDLYRIDPQPDRIAIIRANIDDMISKNTVDVWTWIDAIQMAMPVFAKLGKTLGDTKYFDAMWSLYAHARNTQGGGLFNATEGLWWRDFHFTPGGGTQQSMSASLNGSMPSSSTDAYIVAPNGKNLYWSRGNGWVMAALARVLDELPSTDAHRAQYIADLRAMADALLPIQRSDGFWNESLADPSHCATIGIANQDGPETSGTALFAYGLAWGIRNGHLDAATYGQALVKVWNGLVTTALQSDGLLGYVQSTGDRPCTGPAPLAATALANFDDYGVGCFLLAGSEIYRLTPN
jgi:unsaturated rhamnogalacturonyl hydrolase